MKDFKIGTPMQLRTQLVAKRMHEKGKEWFSPRCQKLSHLVKLAREIISTELLTVTDNESN